MALRGVIAADRNAAIALAARIDNALGLPRCNSPQSGGPAWGRGVRPPCICVPPAVDLACPHVTRTHAEPVQNRAATQWALQVDGAAVETIVRPGTDGTVIDLPRGAWIPAVP